LRAEAISQLCISTVLHAEHYLLYDTSGREAKSGKGIGIPPRQPILLIIPVREKVLNQFVY
jgi:hypothetical protein